MRIHLLHIIACMTVMPLLVCCDKTGSIDFKEPQHIHKPGNEKESGFEKKEGAIRLVSYNVGLFGKYIDSMDMVAAMLKELKADAVCLNELDSCTVRSGGIYQSQALAKKMGNWHHYYAGAMKYNRGSYGEGMVVSPELKNNGTYAIRIPQGLGAEPRVCPVFKTDKFVFLATHLDHVNNYARLDGAIRISEWAKEQYGDTDVPVFLCGDMNCEYNDEPLKRLKEDWKTISVVKNTYPSGPGRYPIKCIDFIFALKNKAKYEVVASDVPLTFENGDVNQASDHLPIYVDVILK